MKAAKGNKEYDIADNQKSTYQNAGFDIYDDNGEQVAFGKGKAVSYEGHMRAVAEIEKLQGLAAERYAENEALKAEIEELKAKNTGQQAADTKSSKKQADKKEGE